MDMNRSSTQKAAKLITLAVLLCALVPATGLATGTNHLFMEGRNLTAEQAASLETGLLENPDNLDSRLHLLGYYFMKRGEQDQEARIGHILWAIEHQPDSEIVGSPFLRLSPMMNKSLQEKVKSMWLKQLENHESNPNVHGNAGRVFILYDRELAAELFAKAQALDSANPMWPQQLGHLYSLGMVNQSGDERKATAARSLEQFDKALAVADEPTRRSLLQSTAKTAFEAGDFDKARSYALEMVSEIDKSSWNYGNAIHHGNLLLGRLALRSDDLEMAKLHLTEAGKTPGSPQLDSFGPNMMLAKELLGKGESEAVLEYFELCGEFWQSGGRLESWAKEVRAGRTPAFGANLSY